MTTDTALATIPKSIAPALEARGIDEVQWAALANVWPGARPASILQARDYCVARQLDPLKKPVHIVPMFVEDKETGQKAMRDVIMPGIYELRVTAFRTGEYAGQDDPEFGPEVEFEGMMVPAWCKVTVHRLTGGQKCSFSHREFYSEAYATESRQSSKPNTMWRKRKYGQLAKCTEAGALRKAFPEECGNIMTVEEMEGRTMIDVTPNAKRSERGDARALNEKLQESEDAPATSDATAPDLESIACDFIVQIDEAESREAWASIGAAISKEHTDVQDMVREAYTKRGDEMGWRRKGKGGAS